MRRRFRQLRHRARRFAPWLAVLARLGYVAKGFVYFSFGTYTGSAALHRGSKPDDVQSALARWANAPFGQPLLAVLAFGLLCYAVWQFVRALLDPDHQGRGLLGLVRRAGCLISGLAFFGLALFAAGVAIRGWGSSSKGEPEQVVAFLLSPPFGPWLVTLAALGAFGVALNHLIVALSGMFLQFLELHRLEPADAAALRRLGQVGLLARGLIYGAVGVLLLRAGRQDNAQAAGGVSEALRLLRGSPFGPWLVGAVALGLMALGLYSLWQARYRRILL